MPELCVSVSSASGSSESLRDTSASDERRDTASSGREGCGQRERMGEGAQGRERRQWMLVESEGWGGAALGEDAWDFLDLDFLGEEPLGEEPFAEVLDLGVPAFLDDAAIERIGRKGEEGVDGSRRAGGGRGVEICGLAGLVLGGFGETV
jgi:hypothetical protein